MKASGRSSRRYFLSMPSLPQAGHLTWTGRRVSVTENGFLQAGQEIIFGPAGAAPAVGEGVWGIAAGAGRWGAAGVIGTGVTGPCAGLGAGAALCGAAGAAGGCGAGGAATGAAGAAGFFAPMVPSFPQ
jgi:hypothetical protein